jgi:formate--tetrahydrofolate ligase
VADVFDQGSSGGLELAQAVARVSAEGTRFRPLYEPELPLVEKIARIATELYGASGVDIEPPAAAALERFEQWGHGRLPVYIAHRTMPGLPARPSALDVAVDADGNVTGLD